MYLLKPKIYTISSAFQRFRVLSKQGKQIGIGSL